MSSTVYQFDGRKVVIWKGRLSDHFPSVLDYDSEVKDSDVWYARELPFDGREETEGEYYESFTCHGAKTKREAKKLAGVPESMR